MFSIYHRYSFICNLNSNRRSLFFRKSFKPTLHWTDEYIGVNGNNEIEVIYIFSPLIYV